ncbi:MAG: hypothetical protein QNL33_10645 [Akkermansiaceae bacterium]|jgi:hypothetical protein
MKRTPGQGFRKEHHVNRDHLKQRLKEHYDTLMLSDSRAEEILAGCEIARTAYRWRRRAIGALSLAVTAMVALGIVLYETRKTDPVAEPLVKKDDRSGRQTPQTRRGDDPRHQLPELQNDGAGLCGTPGKVYR